MNKTLSWIGKDAKNEDEHLGTEKMWNIIGPQNNIGAIIKDW